MSFLTKIFGAKPASCKKTEAGKKLLAELSNPFWDGHAQVVRCVQLIEAGAKLDLVTETGDTALTLAVKRGFDTISMAIIGTYPPHVPLDLGSVTAAAILHRAAETGSRDTAKALRARGLSLTDAQARQMGDRLLTHAVQGGGHAIACIYAGAKLDARDSDSNDSLLHKSAFFGHADVVQALLEEGFYVDTRNDAGETALHRAIFSSKESAALALIAAGADVNCPRLMSLADKRAGFQGMLDDARAERAAAGFIAPVREPVVPDEKERERLGRALIDAARYCEEHACRHLISSGADLTLSDGEWNTARDLADKNGLDEIVDMIDKAGDVIGRLTRARDAFLQKKTTIDMKALDVLAHSGTDAVRESAPMPAIKKNPFPIPGGRRT